MSGATIIGGDLTSITESAKRVRESGTAAMNSHTQTDKAALELQTEINGAMDTLLTKFRATEEELRGDLDTSFKQLDSAEWKGASRDNAVQIKADMDTQIGTVLTQAETALEAEKKAFGDRATALLESVNNEFRNVMLDVQTKMGDLASAAELTGQNLSEADSTIKM